MKKVYGDTHYWIALINPGDQWQEAAVLASEALGQVKIYTSEDVLTELLTFFADEGPYLRKVVLQLVDEIRHDPNVVVVNKSSLGFEKALELYRSRPDKGYSLTDCGSMHIMWEHGINEVLSVDSHFAQEGFTLLIK